MVDEHTSAEMYVEEHREELVDIILNGDSLLRAQAFAILLRGGSQTDIDLVKRELELYESLDEEMRDQLQN